VVQKILGTVKIFAEQGAPAETAQDKKAPKDKKAPDPVAEPETIPAYGWVLVGFPTSAAVYCAFENALSGFVHPCFRELTESERLSRAASILAPAPVVFQAQPAPPSTPVVDLHLVFKLDSETAIARAFGNAVDSDGNDVKADVDEAPRPPLETKAEVALRSGEAADRVLAGQAQLEDVSKVSGLFGVCDNTEGETQFVPREVEIDASGSLEQVVDRVDEALQQVMLRKTAAAKQQQSRSASSDPQASERQSPGMDSPQPHEQSSQLLDNHILDEEEEEEDEDAGPPPITADVSIEEFPQLFASIEPSIQKALSLQWKALEVQLCKTTRSALQAQEEFLAEFATSVDDLQKTFIKLLSTEDEKDRILAQFIEWYNGCYQTSKVDILGEQLDQLSDKLWGCADRKRQLAMRDRQEQLDRGWVKLHLRKVCSLTQRFVQAEYTRYLRTVEWISESFYGALNRVAPEPSHIPAKRVEAPLLSVSLWEENTSPWIEELVARAQTPVFIIEDPMDDPLTDALQLNTDDPFAAARRLPALIIEMQRALLIEKTRYLQRLAMVRRWGLVRAGNVVAVADATFSAMDTWIGERVMGEDRAIQEVVEIIREAIEMGSPVSTSLYLDPNKSRLNADDLVVYPGELAVSPPEFPVVPRKNFTPEQIVKLTGKFPSAVMAVDGFCSVLAECVASVARGEDPALLPGAWIDRPIDYMKILGQGFARDGQVDVLEALLILFFHQGGVERPWPSMPGILRIRQYLFDIDPQRFPDFELTQEQMVQLPVTSGGPLDEASGAALFQAFHRFGGITARRVLGYLALAPNATEGLGHSFAGIRCTPPVDGETDELAVDVVHKILHQTGVRVTPPAEIGTAAELRGMLEGQDGEGGEEVNEEVIRLHVGYAHSEGWQNILGKLGCWFARRPVGGLLP